MKQSVDFSIVFPVMNQADHIGKVIRSYHDILTKNNISFELIAVINGSHDASYDICKKTAANLRGVSVYELKESGYGLGVLHGLRHAKGTYLCYVNCARVYNDELLVCVKKFLKHPDIILHAVRKKRDVWYRRITSLIYNGFCTMLIGISSSDINGTPKIFGREVYKKLDLHFTDSMIDVEFLDKTKRFRMPIKEVPIYKNTRHGGISTSRFSTIFRLIKEMIRYRHTAKCNNKSSS